MPKKQSTDAKRARTAARAGTKYTTALRGASGPTMPDDKYGGHDFAYEGHTDLFRCTDCRLYEVAVRAADGTITPCTGPTGYQGDTERIYLLLTVNPELPDNFVTALSHTVRKTGIGRSPSYSWRNGELLIESAPSVVDELIPQIEQITFDTTLHGHHVRAVTTITRLTAEAGRAVIAENYAAYIAKYGERQ